ncbi:MAG TPA: antibiotic biosynthesis monooxygenase family protein [Hyphomonadaceae bacterium]|jgi:quinol monooxygenase YgiN|nr:antibiotic biosynthesis monooxygenase family protein [Hyphomonadaceae bacterium]
MVTQIITFRAKPEKLGEFADVIRGVKSTLPQIPGCKAVRIHQGTDDPCVFTLVETWESEERHREHIAGLVADGSWADISTLLAGEPESRYYAEL